MELLDKALSDSESELEIEVEFRVEYKPTAFSLLFTDDDVKELWDPFVDTTEESQSEMLKNLFPAATPRRKSKRMFCCCWLLLVCCLFGAALMLA